MSNAFQNVLVPIDFSEHADRALAYAMMWCRQLKGHLTLIHVVQSLNDVGLDMLTTLPTTYLETLEQELTHHLQRYLQRVQDAGIEGDLVIVHGSPVRETIDTVKARRIDLIIMGSHGRTGVSHMLLGSMAEKLVRLAPCPVLVVR